MSTKGNVKCDICKLPIDSAQAVYDHGHFFHGKCHAQLNFIPKQRMDKSVVSSILYAQLERMKLLDKTIREKGEGQWDETIDTIIELLEDGLDALEKEVE